MIRYNNVRGTMQTVEPIEVNKDTVYVRSSIIAIQEEDFKGWQYDEVQYSIQEYMQVLTEQEDVGMLALIVSILMSEIDSIKNTMGVV